MTTLHRRYSLVLCLLLAATMAVTATAQQGPLERRIKQLSVFEDLLTETVQERVERSVNATIDATRRGDSDGDGVVDEVAAEPLVVKVGAPLAAHGLYVEGYGVMFSIQTPQVSVIPKGFEAVFSGPAVLSQYRGGVGGQNAPVGTIELRADMIELRAGMIDRNLDELIVLLERQDGNVDAVTVQELQGLRGKLEDIRRASVEAAPKADAHVVDESESAAVAARVEAERERDAARSREFRLQNRWESYYRVAAEQRSSMKAVLERNHRQVSEAMNRAAIETIASYGTLIKGLGDDERIAVIVTPPNTWSLARRFGVGDNPAEHVISVRYRDIRDLDDAKIDYDEFVRRVQIRDRLGEPLVHEDEEAQR